MEHVLKLAPSASFVRPAFAFETLYPLLFWFTIDKGLNATQAKPIIFSSPSASSSSASTFLFLLVFYIFLGFFFLSPKTRFFTFFISRLASIAAISSLIGVSVSTADLILRLFGWFRFLGGAFDNGLSDSGENTLEVVARGLQTVDGEATSSLVLLLRPGGLLKDVMFW